MFLCPFQIRRKMAAVVKDSDDINQRITDVAIALAEEGGFENVRQRDVAARAGVALGTLYKRFRSKEDILSAALERETEKLAVRMEKNPPKGATVEERLKSFYRVVTRAMIRRPHFARAVLRAVASGQPEVARHVTAYQGRMAGMVIACMRGVGRLTYGDAAANPPTDDEETLAVLLQQNWFSSLVGWSAGLHNQTTVIQHISRAVELLLAGMESEGRG